jgi:hypothetical protein
VPLLRPAVCVLCVLGSATQLGAQTATDDPVARLLTRLELILGTDDRAAFPSLFSTATEEQIERYQRELFTAGAIRSVLRERDRAMLEGVPEGDGYQVVVEVFSERSGTARIVTAGMEVLRPANGDADSWRIVRMEGMSAVEGLHRLRLNTSAAYEARDFEVTSEDLLLTLDGTVFHVESDDGVTGLVLLGRGQMRFSPRPEAEQVQLRIFSGNQTLVTPFEHAFVRVSPSDYRRRTTTERLTPITPDQRAIRQAQQVFDRESPKSFNVDLQDLSRDAWHLLPPAGDLLAEVRTRRHDTLTYSLSASQAEDISLFQRDRRRTIALYASLPKIEARGRFYSDDALRDYDVLDYNIEASIVPDRQLLQGRVRLALRVRAPMISTVLLRLAEPLVVSGVTSVEYGRLLHLRIRNQNMILVNLPRPALQDSDVTLVVTYAGQLPSHEVDIDTVSVAQDAPRFPNEFAPARLEPHYLLSSRSFWYPQNPVSDYATATMRITVPRGYGCIASGEPVTGSDAVTLRDLLTLPNGDAFVFRTNQPVRYLALIVGRFVRVAETVVSLHDEDGTGIETVRVDVVIEATPRQQGRARSLVQPTEDIMRFYARLMGEAPYRALTIAVVESELPGGHAPAFFVMLNDPIPNPNITWRNDPAAFDNFPEFFLAHEIAHQWWGQAVGWKNYHEQWISEGFAQYFAALYAHETRGDRVFNDMLRQFRRWALSQSDQGPVHLGYRLGHIKEDLRTYRAIVYNKGAAVLHMLRRLVGDDIFFSGLRTFYEDRRYQKAGTDDLQRAFERVSGLELDRFFDRWIHGTEIPRVRYSTTIGTGAVHVRFHQVGTLVFDLPVTVTLTYTDGRTEEVVVRLAESVVEQSIPTSGPIRRIQINNDSAALGEFSEMR